MTLQSGTTRRIEGVIRLTQRTAKAAKFEESISSRPSRPLPRNPEDLRNLEPQAVFP